MQPTTGYRADIDGLRALAVVPIVLFHLGMPGFTGGFVGVDIFFVLSGYLIARMVFADLHSGTFSLGQHFRRRVGRIVPALLVVVLCSLVAGSILLLPQELAALASSALAAALFISNFHFWQHVDYFEESGTAPLLHLWSLGVEAQFYLLFPVLAVVLFRFGPRCPLLGFAAFGLASAVVSLKWPELSFFLLPARLWELLLGVMLAITSLPFASRRFAREGLAAAGLLLIVFAVISFDQDTPFPGWRAAIPCAGAAAIILAGSCGRSFVGRLLELRPLTFLGRISYSLYLWHWPVIVFLLLGLPATELSPLWQGLALALSLGLAVASWHMVEQPWRKPDIGFRRLALASGGSVVAIALVAMAIQFSGGWPQRFSARTQQISAALDYPVDEVFRSDKCFLYRSGFRLDRQECMTGEAMEPQVLVLGDSHAAHLWPGLSQTFSGSSILQATANGCRPVLDQAHSTRAYCSEMVRWVYDEVLPAGQIDLLVLAAYWEAEDLPWLSETLLELEARGQDVLVIGPAASWDIFVPKLLALAHIRNEPALPDAFLVPERRPLDRQMAALAQRYGAAYFSMIDTQCPRGCRYFDAANNPLIVDDAHLTWEASLWITSHITHPALRRGEGY